MIKGAEAEAEVLMAAMAPLPSEATEEDLKALQHAYDVFMYKVFGVIADGIENVSGMSSDNSKSIYDLSGRRLRSTSQKGVYIVGGKKIVN